MSVRGATHHDRAPANRDSGGARLRDHDLACWCPLDQPCHADVLLEIANPGFPPTPKETQ